MNLIHFLIRCCVAGAIGLGVLAWASGCNRAAGPNNANAQTEGGHDDHGHGEGEHADEVRLTADAIARYGVKVEQASLRTLLPTFTAPARVAFNREAMAHVGSPLPGRAVEIKVRVGDVVAKGDPLLIVESPELGEAQADFFQKRVVAETAGPVAELARLAWERAKGLLEESQGISLTEVQKREAEYKAAVAGMKSAEAGAIGAENRLHLLGMSQDAVMALAASGEIDPRFTIKASIDGQVIEREVTLGELVNPDRETVMVLADTTTLWVLADVPEARLAEVALGAAVWINAGSLDAHRHQGAVSHISPMIDPRTRTAAVRVVVKCEDQSLKPGMFVQVEIASTNRGEQQPAPVVAIREEAVQMIEGRPAVFVPVSDEENTFSVRFVSIGKAVGEIVPVHSGLAEGAQFVVAGSFILKAELGKSSTEHVH